MTSEIPNYQSQLLSTREQLNVLREYNQRYWEDHFKEPELAALDVNYHAQTLDNVAVIHAEFGSIWETLCAWSSVYMSGRTTHFNTVPSDRKSFNKSVRLHEQTARYTPGLHIVHMDLTRDQDTYRTMDEAYAAAEETPGLLLAHGEALALVGLHRALRESPDGYARAKTPYLPGYQAKNVFVPEAWAGDWDWVARFDQGRPQEGWGLRTFPTQGSVNISGAVLFVHGDQGA